MNFHTVSQSIETFLDPTPFHLQILSQRQDPLPWTTHFYPNFFQDPDSFPQTFPIAPPTLTLLVYLWWEVGRDAGKGVVVAHDVEDEALHVGDEDQGLHREGFGLQEYAKMRSSTEREAGGGTDI